MEDFHGILSYYLLNQKGTSNKHLNYELRAWFESPYPWLDFTAAIPIKKILFTKLQVKGLLGFSINIIFLLNLKAQVFVDNQRGYRYLSKMFCCKHIWSLTYFITINYHSWKKKCFETYEKDERQVLFLLVCLPSCDYSVVFFSFDRCCKVSKRYRQNKYVQMNLKVLQKSWNWKQNSFDSKI